MGGVGCYYMLLLLGRDTGCLCFFFGGYCFVHFFFGMGDGGLLAWDGASRVLVVIILYCCLGGRVSLGVFLVVLDTPGWRTDAWARIGDGGLWEGVFYGEGCRFGGDVNRSLMGVYYINHDDFVVCSRRGV